MQLEAFAPGQIRVQPGEVAKFNRAVSDLYVGQVLKTVVVKAVNDQTVMININGNNINAQTAHHYQPGQELNVQVASKGNEIQLQILPQIKASQFIQQGISQNITQQLPINQVLQQMAYLMKNDQLPMQSQSLLQSWTQSLPLLNQLSQALPNQVQNSGLFFENKLQQAVMGKLPQLKGDLKALLFQLLGSTRQPAMKLGQALLPQQTQTSPQHATLPLPGAIPQPFPQPESVNLFQENLSLSDQLHLAAKAGLARISSLQLSHLGLNQNQANFQILLDLPFKFEEHVETIPFLIKQDARQTKTAAATWTAKFALNLPNLGPLQAAIQLTNTNLGVDIHVEMAESEHLLNEIRPMLSEWAQAQGLHLGRWQIHYGLEPNQFQEHSFSMVDIKL